MPWSCRSLGITVEPMFFLYMLAVWLTLITGQALTYRKVCMIVYSNNTAICDHLKNGSFTSEEAIVQKDSARWFLYGDICFGIISVISAGFIGSWGDRISRKLPLVLPIIGHLIGSVIFIILSFYMQSPLWILLLPNIATGIFGGVTVSILGAFSYVSASTDATSRTSRLSILQAMMALGACVALGGGGAFLDLTNFVVVFSTIAGILLLALAYTIFCVDDIRGDIAERSKQDICRSLFSLENAKETLVCLCRKRDDNKRTHIAVLFLSAFVFITCAIGLGQVTFLYLKRQPLSWNQTTYGLFEGLKQLLSGLSLLFLLPLMNKRMKVHETTLIIIGAISLIAYEILLGIKAVTWMVFLAAANYGLHMFSLAGTRALLSTMVDQNELGKLFAGFSSMESMCVVIGGLIFNNLYPATVQIYPGLCFFLAAGLTTISLGLMLWLKVSLKRTMLYSMLAAENGPQPINTTKEHLEENGSQQSNGTHGAEINVT